MKKTMKMSVLGLLSVLALPTIQAQGCFDITPLESDEMTCFDENIVKIIPAEGYKLYEWQITKASSDHPRHALKTDSREYDALVTDLKVLPPNGAPTIMLATEPYAYGQYGQGAGVVFKHTVTAENPIILFNFAGIMEKTLHVPNYQIPNFNDYIQPSIDFYMTIGEKGHEQTLKETPIHFTPNESRTWIPVIDSRGYAAVWRDWTTMAFDLTKYIGQQVNIFATVRDCAFEDVVGDVPGGNFDFLPCAAHHTARLYCNVDCASDMPIVEQDCEGGMTTLKMAEGFYTYEWYYSNEPENILGTTSEIRIPTHHKSDTMCCAVTHYVLPDTAIVKKFFLDNCGQYEICADAQSVDLSLFNWSATIDHCDVVFSQEGLAQGFQNLTNEPVPSDKKITISLPTSDTIQYVRPDTYTAEVTAYFADGTSATSTKYISVLYPSSVLGQDWNDVLYVKNKAYNGGYDITSVSWFKNGKPQTGSGTHGAYLYSPTAFDGQTEYWAELTRSDDNKTIRTCSCQPGQQKNPEHIQFDIQVASNAPGHVTITSTYESGEYRLYNLCGQPIQSGYFGPQYNATEQDIVIRSVAGTYIMVCQGERSNKSIKLIIE